MNNRKTRSSLIGITGGYLMYLAYQLFEGRNDPGTTMAPWLTILFVILFAAAGAGLLVYAWRAWKQADRDEEEEKKNDQQSLK